jgi:hypothetical protein
VIVENADIEETDAAVVENTDVEDEGKSASRNYQGFALPPRNIQETFPTGRYNAIYITVRVVVA